MSRKIVAILGVAGSGKTLVAKRCATYRCSQPFQPTLHGRFSQVLDSRDKTAQTISQS